MPVGLGVPELIQEYSAVALRFIAFNMAEISSRGSAKDPSWKTPIRKKQVDFCQHSIPWEIAVGTRSIVQPLGVHGL